MSIQEQHTAGAQSLGFDYQLYYFVLLALELKQGQKIGFEVKDDIHIDREDGTTILFQAKHTKHENQNLTTLDVDLWKTISNWVEFIKAGNKNFLDKNFFVLVTNKNEGSNEFIDTLYSQDIDTVFSKLKELKDRTKDETIKKYINNVISLGKSKLKIFLAKLSIEINTDNIIKRVKDKILDQIRGEEKFVQPIYEKLISNIQETKYLDIKDKNKFEISREEFDRNFRRCFNDAYKDKPLPKRTYKIQIPDNLEEQMFVKQMVDIGYVKSGSPKIIKYTTQMLQVIRHLSDWENNFVLPSEMDEFKKEAIIKWENEFDAKYRSIERKITSGHSISELEIEIQTLGNDLIDFLKRENLAIAGDTLGIELSNGHYYALSNTPEIGWHYDWENKYKKG
jgi:hypothetical protein